MRRGELYAFKREHAAGWKAPHVPPVRNPPPPRPGVQLTPIPWGKPDRALARAVCQHLVDANPRIAVDFNPFHHRRLIAFLRSHGIAH